MIKKKHVFLLLTQIIRIFFEDLGSSVSTSFVVLPSQNNVDIFVLMDMLVKTLETQFIVILFLLFRSDNIDPKRKARIFFSLRHEKRKKSGDG